MHARLAYGLIAAAVLSFPASATAQDDDDTQVTLVGCIEREADYRRQRDLDRGGFFGLGVGNEYILNTNCGASAGGDMYELTGGREGKLKDFVGQRVRIVGMLKDSDIDPETGRPEGGVNFPGEDLKLHEVDVMAYHPMPVQVAPSSPFERASRFEQSAQAAPAAGPFDDDRRSIGTSGAEDQQAARDFDTLPRTASPLALAGLAGLLSLVGALGVRRGNRYRE